jgi:hypothetical protein
MDAAGKEACKVKNLRKTRVSAGVAGEGCGNRGYNRFNRDCRREDGGNRKGEGRAGPRFRSRDNYRIVKTVFIPSTNGRLAKATILWSTLFFVCSMREFLCPSGKNW